MPHPRPGSEQAEASLPSLGVAGARPAGSGSPPSYAAETLDTYFRPAAEATFRDPTVGPVLQELARNDPDVIAAVADVDRFQIWDMLRCSPTERLARVCRLAHSLSEYRDGGR